MTTELQQLAQTDRNPIQEQRYQQLLTDNGIPFTVVNGHASVEGFGVGGNTAGTAADSFFSTPNLQALNLMKTTADAYAKQLDEYNSKLNEFDQNNPFVFDDMLAQNKTQVKERLDPYYQQTLNDFLRGVNVQRKRGLEDSRQVLSDIQRDTTDYTKEQQAGIQSALDKSGQGFANAGLFDSGARMSDQGNIEASGNVNLNNYLKNADRQTNQINLNQSRLGEDLSNQEATQRRNLNTEENFNVTSQALDRTQQQQQQREFERQQYAGTPPGVSPLTYQNNLYSFLTG